MVAVIAEFKANEQLATMRFPFFLTVTDHHGYLNIRLEDIADDSTPEVNGYVFVKYELATPHKLTCYSMALQPVIAAIQTGTLKGKLSYRNRPETAGGKPSRSQSKKRIASVTITDTTTRVLRFIERSDHRALFIDPMVFERIE
jgi:hypothetical protein